MANEQRRPGGPPGILNILRDEFHVPPMPTIGRNAALERVREIIANRALSCQGLALSDQPVARGALFDASGARVPFPESPVYERCYVALIDPEPATTRWAHPAHWAFVPADGQGDVVLLGTELPEHGTGSVRLLPESPRP